MRALLLLGLMAGCSIPTETFIGFPCAALTCGDNSTCVETAGVAACACNEGFQDNDGDGACSENCDAFACDTRKTCDDATGTARCVCAAGFQDNDGNGECAFACSALNCGVGGTCNDSTGTATCGCALGYQDNDGDGECAPSCDSTTCGASKGCNDSSGVAQCVCAAGLQDNDNNGTCTPSCASLTCGTNTAGCSDSSGTAYCNCTGNFVDFDGDGNCTATCGSNLINSTVTGGTATVVSIDTTSPYSSVSYIGGSCSSHRDATGSICDNAPHTNSPKLYSDVPGTETSGARFRSNNSLAGEGVLVIDAGSSVTFNAVQIYQFFRRYGGQTRNKTQQVRFSRHASTTSAPAYNDAGWIPLTAGFDTLSNGVDSSNVISLPWTVSVAPVATRYLRVEVKNAQYSTAIRNVKMFLCQ